MLVSRLIGPSGEVVGIERDSRSIASARVRVAEAGLHNVSFIESDVSQITDRKPFDAAVGRFILMWLPDPVSVCVNCLSWFAPWSRCLSGTALGTGSFAFGAITPLVCGGFFGSQNVSKVWSKSRVRLCSLPGVPGRGAAWANHASRDTAGEGSRHRTMVRRYYLHFAATD